MSILHRQVFKELLSLFSLTAVALLTLLLIGRMLQLRELFLSQNMGFVDIASMFLYLSPFFLLLIIPIACMLSVFLTFLRMGTDLESVALKSSGISLYQLLPAPVFFCLLCVVANMAISFWGVSWGMENFRAQVLEIARTKTQLVMQAGVFNKDFPNLTVFAQQADNTTGELTTVFVQDRTHESVKATILAPTGNVHTDSDKGEIVFHLRDGRIYRQEKGAVSVVGFGTYQVRMDLSKLLSGYDLGDIKPKEMSWEELHEANDDPATLAIDNGMFSRKVKVEIQKRLVLPLACLVLGLFALPMAASFGGLNRHWGLILALGFFLFYYTLLSLGLSLGETGTVPPIIGLWLPNVLFLIVGVVGIRMAAMERAISVAAWLSHLKLHWARRVSHAN
nr:LPS export ABC transporter permease LptF [Desulfovibrio ferrophilus]